MDPSQWWKISVLVVLLVISAFFSASETALLATNKIRIKTLADEKNKRAIVVLKLLDNVDILLTTVLIGNNIANLSASSLATILAIDFFGNTAAGFVTGALTIVILIFSEITPKSLANKYATTISLFIARPLHFIALILKPMAYLLDKVSGFFIRLFGGDLETEPTLTEEELKTYVNVSHAEGILEEEEKEMIHNVFEFGDTEIREVMTPRIHSIALQSDITYDEMVSIYQKERFSRMPVLNDSFDEVIGVFYVKDIILKDHDFEAFNIIDYVRKPFFVYEFNRLSDVFTRMKKARVTLAVVLDEYGVMSGILTLEDMVEEIVGDITDEYDEIENVIQKIDDYTYFIDGSVSFLEINEITGSNFSSEEFESIGGMVLGELGSEPSVGQEVMIQNNLLKIEKIDKNRIELLKLILNKK